MTEPLTYDIRVINARAIKAALRTVEQSVRQHNRRMQRELGLTGGRAGLRASATGPRAAARRPRVVDPGKAQLALQAATTRRMQTEARVEQQLHRQKSMLLPASVTSVK